MLDGQDRLDSNVSFICDYNIYGMYLSNSSVNVNPIGIFYPEIGQLPIHCLSKLASLTWMPSDVRLLTIQGQRVN